MIRGMSLAVVSLIATVAQGKVVCYTCRDTGSVTVECPICGGTKYVWKHSYRSYSSSTTEDFCGYGAWRRRRRDTLRYDVGDCDRGDEGGLQVLQGCG